MVHSRDGAPLATAVSMHCCKISIRLVNSLECGTSRRSPCLVRAYRNMPGRVDVDVYSSGLNLMTTIGLLPASWNSAASRLCSHDVSYARCWSSSISRIMIHVPKSKYKSGRLRLHPLSIGWSHLMGEVRSSV